MKNLNNHRKGIMYPFNSRARPPGTGVNAPLDSKGRTALHFAVESGNIHEIEKLLRVGAKPDQQDNDGESPLFIAISLKNTAVIEKLLEKGATFSLRNDKGETALESALGNDVDVEFIEGLKPLGGRINIPPDHKKSVLHAAIEKNAAPDVVLYLVSEGIPVNQQDEDGKTPLHIAIQSKNYVAIEQLLALGADPVMRDNKISTPLHYAAAAGDEKAVDLLLSCAQVRQVINDYKTYDDGFTPLMAAVKGNHTAIIEKIVGIGGDVNQTDNRQRHSLFIAVEEGNLSAAKTLLKLGADVEKNQRSINNRSRMVHCVSPKNYADILLLLHQAGVDINIRDGSGQTALHRACDEFNKDKVKALLDLGADPNIANEFGKRPLDIILDHYYYEMHHGHELAAMLLAKNADPNIGKAPEARSAPLHICAREGRVEMTKLLIKNNAMLDIQDKNDNAMTPFLLAVERGHFEVAKLLKDAGADMLKSDNTGRNALHLAAAGGNAEAVKMVLMSNIDINAKDREGRTALHHACRMDRIEAVKVLLENNAQPDIYDVSGQTPVHMAAQANSEPLLSFFAASKNSQIDINATTRDEGFTPLHIAAFNNHQMLVIKLLELGADPAKPSKNDLLPLHYAILNDHIYVAETLLAAMKMKQIPIDSLTDKNGWTLLHYAVTKETPQMAAMVIAAGADVQATTETGDTALHTAVLAGRLSVVEYLVETKEANMVAANKEGDTPLSIAFKQGRPDILAYLAKKMAEKTPRQPDTAASDKHKKHKKPPGHGL